MILIWKLSLSVIACRKYWFRGKEYLCKNSSSLGLILFDLDSVALHYKSRWVTKGVFTHHSTFVSFCCVSFFFSLLSLRQVFVCALHLRDAQCVLSQRPEDVARARKNLPRLPSQSGCVHSLAHWCVLQLQSNWIRKIPLISCKDSCGLIR